MSGGRRRVLVAEDHPSIRRILCHVLEEGGFETMEASDGLEAVELARSQHPDLIFLDVMMPMLDGVSACRMIKADPRTAGIPVAICTSRDRQADVLRALSAGADDYILKPFQTKMVLDRALRILKSARRPERRAAARVPVDWDVEVSTHGDVRRFTRTRDVSATGVGISVEGDPPAEWGSGETMHMWLRVGTSAIVEAIARIVHLTRPSAPEDRTVVGMAFTEISEPARKMIERSATSTRLMRNPVVESL